MPDTNLATILLGYNLPTTSTSSNVPVKNNSEPYFLYVGSFRINKNIPRLIKAFRLVAAKNSNVNLVLAGGAGNTKDQIMCLAAQEGVSTKIKFLGFVSDMERDELYNNAIALVHPSLYEGFGMTVLEAMGRGCPVISSNATSLPEVVGNAGLLFAPEDVEDMAAKMLCILTTDKLCDDLREKGLRRAKEFTWAKTAAATMAVYEDVANQCSSLIP